jgi:GNAT superfamily N-acetyltransferase
MPSRSSATAPARRRNRLSDAIAVRHLALPAAGFDALAAEAHNEDCVFVERLAAEWASGRNRFDAAGELLLGTFDGATLTAVGGLNRDPYTAEPGVARLRHLYVRPAWRRHGVGAALVAALIAAARDAGFACVQLRTSRPPAARLYERHGFVATVEPDATHRLAL